VETALIAVGQAGCASLPLPPRVSRKSLSRREDLAKAPHPARETQQLFQTTEDTEDTEKGIAQYSAFSAFSVFSVV